MVVITYPYTTALLLGIVPMINTHFNVFLDSYTVSLRNPLWLCRFTDRQWPLKT